MTRIAYLPGDGIGPEVLGVARRVLEAAGLEADWIELPVGWGEWCARGNALPEGTLDGVRECEAILFGAITSKPDDQAEAELAPALQGRGLRYVSPILRLRRELDLYGNIRPIRSYPGNPANVSDHVDMMIFRENTEGLYAGLEARPLSVDLQSAFEQAWGRAAVPQAGADTAVSVRVVTRRATQRIMRAAFDYALRHRRRKVTLLEKANVVRATGGLVREVFHEEAARHANVRAEELNIDAACAQVVRNPAAFDVVVATNLFGDIFSDVAAEVAGGLPLAASANIGDRHALFEPVHGSAPDIAGHGVANPAGAVLAGALMARHLGRAAVADRLEAAVTGVVRDPGARPMTLRAWEDALVRALAPGATARSP